MEKKYWTFFSSAGRGKGGGRQRRTWRVFESKAEDAPGWARMLGLKLCVREDSRLMVSAKWDLGCFF